MELHGGCMGCVKWQLISCAAWGIRSSMPGVPLTPTCMAQAARLLPHGICTCLTPACLLTGMHAALSRC